MIRDLRNRKHDTMPLFSETGFHRHGSLAVCSGMRLLVCDGLACALPRLQFDTRLCEKSRAAIEKLQYRFYRLRDTAVLSIRLCPGVAGIAISMLILHQRPIEIIQRLVRRKRAARRLAIAMAMHERLGQSSGLSVLPEHLLQLISTI